MYQGMRVAPVFLNNAFSVNQSKELCILWKNKTQVHQSTVAVHRTESSAHSLVDSYHVPDMMSC